MVVSQTHLMLPYFVDKKKIKYKKKNFKKNLDILKVVDNKRQIIKKI